MSSLYTIETAVPLPRVATSITLGAALLGRADDTAFNAAIVQAVNRYSALLHVNAMVFGCCSSFVFIIQDQVTAAALSVSSFTLMLLNITLLLASLLRDLVVLTTKTYEFWFLTFLNFVGFGCMCLVLNDVRVFASAVSAGFCQVAFLLDGNIHARQLIIRSFALASPLISGALTALVIQCTPRLQHTVINMGRGHEGDIVDVVIHCFTTMATFLAVKVVRSRKLVFPSREPIRNIRCDVYYPVCHLVPIIAGQRPSKPSIQTIANQTYSKITQLELKRDDIPVVVDADSTIMSVTKSRAICSLLPCINPIGYVGLVSSWFACAWHIYGSNQTGQWNPSQMLVSITGVTATFVFAMIYVCHAPTVLLADCAVRLMLGLSRFSFRSLHLECVIRSLGMSGRWPSYRLCYGAIGS